MHEHSALAKDRARKQEKAAKNGQIIKDYAARFNCANSRF